MAGDFWPVKEYFGYLKSVCISIVLDMDFSLYCQCIFLQ